MSNDTATLIAAIAGPAGIVIGWYLEGRRGREQRKWSEEDRDLAWRRARLDTTAEWLRAERRMVFGEFMAAANERQSLVAELWARRGSDDEILGPVRERSIVAINRLNGALAAVQLLSSGPATAAAFALCDRLHEFSKAVSAHRETIDAERDAVGGAIAEFVGVARGELDALATATVQSIIASASGR